MLLVYLGLVVLAAGCASMSIVPSDSHHHSHDATHSALCAWSCQIMSQDGLVASVPTAGVSLVVIPLASSLTYSQAASPFASRLSRAPPVFALG